MRGGFNWAMTFKWKPVPFDGTRHSSIDPVASPTMAGGAFQAFVGPRAGTLTGPQAMPTGLFSIHRDYFQKIATCASGPGTAMWGWGEPADGCLGDVTWCDV